MKREIFCLIQGDKEGGADQIFVVKQLYESLKEKEKLVHLVLVDLNTKFDRVNKMYFCKWWRYLV